MSSSARVMREGDAAIVIAPLALFVLGGAAANDGSAHVFSDDVKRRLGYLPILGF